MKVIAFGVRKDEEDYFRVFSKKYNIDIELVNSYLGENNVALAKGYDGIIFIGKCDLNKEVLKKIYSYNIKYIASRSIGYDNVDINFCKEIGIKVSNSHYSPDSVAEYPIMYGIMLLRNIPLALKNSENNNFSIKGLIGRELSTVTVGIIGTGRIGENVAKKFNALGSKVIAYDIFQKESLKNILNYVSIDELFHNSDIISIHAPITKDSYHLINDNSIKKMKDNVIIINTARGEFIDNSSLIKNLENKKIGGLAIDVFEGEIGITHEDLLDKNISIKFLEDLKKFQNVIVTPHLAFYTETAVSDMIEKAIINIKSFIEIGDAPSSIF